MFRSLVFGSLFFSVFFFNSVGFANSSPEFRCLSEQGAADQIKLSWEGMNPTQVIYEGPEGQPQILSGEALDYYFVSDRQIILYLLPFGPDNPVFFNAIITDNRTYVGKLFIGQKSIPVICQAA